ncbi:MAG: hypothetical protein AB7T22_03860 [Calditrichaceae bacterium]
MSGHTHKSHSKLTARLIITMLLNFLITAIEVILMAKPPELSIDEIGREIKSLENIRNIHHVHLWRIL